MLSKREARHAQESERGMGGTRGGINESYGTSKLGGTLPKRKGKEREVTKRYKLKYIVHNK